MNSKQKKSWSRYHINRNKKLELRLISRVSVDVDNGYIEKAISRYEGFFKICPTNQNIHNEIAKLYIIKGNLVKAGQHLILKKNLTQTEKECVLAFKKSCGNSPTLILKKIIPKSNYKVRILDNDIQYKLKEMVEESTNELNVTPNFLQGIKRYLDKVESS